MRHIIVHKNGWVDDKSTFIKNSLKAVGVSNSDRRKQEYIDLINYYFGSDEYENMIHLLEDGYNLDILLALYEDRLGNLLIHLISHSMLIYNSVIERLQKNTQQSV